MCLLFTLVTGNCDILECAPVLLIALQCQFLGSVKYITERGRHVRLDDGKKKKKRGRASQVQRQQGERSQPPMVYTFYETTTPAATCLSAKA